MVVDSSVFFEILSNGPLREKCEKHIHKTSVYVPTIVLFEIYRKLKSKVSEHEALAAVAALRANTVVDATTEVALLAGDLSLEYKLSMADSFVLAHAHLLECPLLTLDNDFASAPGTIIIRI